MLIYLRAGRTIYNKRKQLHNITPIETESDAYTTAKTTEVCVTTEVVDHTGGVVAPSAVADRHRRGSSVATSSNPQQSQGMAAYSVMISADIENQPHNEGVVIQAGATTAVKNGITAQQRRKNLEAHNAAWSYTKCAILFFTAILITWIPSSANRAYSVINGGRSILGLEYAAAFVLPLQGLWNCVIYITTSMTGCKTYFRELGLLPPPKAKESIALRPEFSRRENAKRYETESMTELQISRPASDDDLRH